MINKFSINDAENIKNIEKTTNHDVKAVEYYFKDFLDKKGLSEFTEFVHFGLTSQDINTCSLMLSIKKYLHNDFKCLYTNLTYVLIKKIQNWNTVVIMSRTHGQPASPTTMGKEYKVFLYRLNNQYNNNIKIYTKFGGAVGNFNAHYLAYPDIDWEKFANEYINKMGMLRSKYTTQIENYDSLANILDNLKRINTILIDLCQDTWLYISYNYFNLKINKNEVGSSTMPHKINPIDFENAEGNLYLANCIIELMSRKLPISRLQRDLSDSTITRNIGTIFGYITIAFKSIITGLNKLEVNTKVINQDLENNWVIVSEGIQHLLRKKGLEGYEILKELTRNNKALNKTNLINELIEYLDQEELEQITNLVPENCRKSYIILKYDIVL